MLYQNYRPKSIEEMLGNEKTLAAFAKHFSVKTHSHVHCLSGARGVGKTTLARIAANMLGATDLGITEVNCGTERGIASMKDVIDLAPYRPPSGKARVIILDEAHSLLAPAKKALLKPTEDVPPFTYYFFCTTDPDALFAGDAGLALKSRMTCWKLSPLTPADIHSLVSRVAEAEKITLAPETLSAIVKGCGGVPREALVLLEQAITGEPMVVSGGESDTAVIDFCRLLYKACGHPNMWPSVGPQLRNLKKQGVMMEAIRHTALAYASSTLIAREDPAALTIIDFLSEPVYDSGEAFPKMVAQAYKICHHSI